MNRRNFVSLLGMVGAVAAIAPKVTAEPVATLQAVSYGRGLTLDSTGVKFIYEGKTVASISESGVVNAGDGVAAPKN